MKCQLKALDSDNCLEALEQKKSAIFVLGSDKKMYHLKQENEGKDFNCLQIYDFSMHKITISPWITSCLGKGNITQGSYFFIGESQDYKSHQPKSIEWKNSKEEIYFSTR